MKAVYALLGWLQLGRTVYYWNEFIGLKMCFWFRWEQRPDVDLIIRIGLKLGHDPSGRDKNTGDLTYISHWWVKGNPAPRSVELYYGKAINYGHHDPFVYRIELAADGTEISRTLHTLLGSVVNA